MQNSFRSGFILSGIITLVSIPLIVIGFFPLTLIMGFISLVCLALWMTMRSSNGKHSFMEETNGALPTADKSKVVVGGNSENSK